MYDVEEVSEEQTNTLFLYPTNEMTDEECARLLEKEKKARHLWEKYNIQEESH